MPGGSEKVPATAKSCPLRVYGLKGKATVASILPISFRDPLNPAGRATGTRTVLQQRCWFFSSGLFPKCIVRRSSTAHSAGPHCPYPVLSWSSPTTLVTNVRDLVDGRTEPRRHSSHNLRELEQFQPCSVCSLVRTEDSSS